MSGEHLRAPEPAPYLRPNPKHWRPTWCLICGRLGCCQSPPTGILAHATHTFPQQPLPAARHERKSHTCYLPLLGTGEIDLLEGVHPQGDTHSGAVGKESSKGRLFKEAKYQDLVPKIKGEGKCFKNCKPKFTFSCCVKWLTNVLWISCI